MMRDNFEQYVAQAQKVRRLIVEDFDKVFNDQKVNILLTPVTFGDAPTFAKWTQKENRERLANEDFFTQPANMAGLPAVAVPCKLSKAGLPLALQLIGPYLQDHFVLSMAQVLEDISQFPTLQFVD
jgi:aspartyl-tRNA(Asn)/glutamyl-tRNA(Gln) amidotransferase subunit A